jgi:hypothetical protein
MHLVVATVATVTMEEGKKTVKSFILDRGESWGTIHNLNKTLLILECKDKKNCDFYLRLIEVKKQGYCAVTIYRPHVCPPRTHANFKSRNAAWYIRSKFERDIAKNRKIIVKDLRERADLYHAIPNLLYMAAWRAAERVRADIDRDEGASFQLIPDYQERVAIRQLNLVLTPFKDYTLQVSKDMPSIAQSLEIYWNLDEILRQVINSEGLFGGSTIRHAFEKG